MAAAVAAAVVLKQNKTPAAGNAPAQATFATANQVTTVPSVAAKLPRLVDLGAGKCIPCKMMKPILDELPHLKNRDIPSLTPREWAKAHPEARTLPPE